MGVAQKVKGHSHGIAGVSLAPPDPLFGMKAVYLADAHDKKVSLMVGAYRDDDGLPWKLPVIRTAEARLFNSPGFGHEYSPIAGNEKFNSAAQKLVLGESSAAISGKRVCSFQSLSGTGALHLGGCLLAKFLPGPRPTIYVPSPTWPLHAKCFEQAGLRVKTYPYYSQASHSLDLDGLLSALREVPDNSVVLFQVCAHNPSGVDPSEEQWRQIASVVQAKSLFPFLDCAYQGFASGSLTKDNYAVRLLVEQGLEMCIAQSFSKNMGLYGQRVGCFHYIAAPGSDAQNVTRCVASQLSAIVRAEISSPPAYGAQLASTVLNDQELFVEWEGNLRTMSERLTRMRGSLRQELERLETPGTWKHITDQIGMFAYTGLTEAQCLRLRKKHHIYMSLTGRISMCDVNSNNVRYVAQAIHEVVVDGSARAESG